MGHWLIVRKLCEDAVLYAGKVSRPLGIRNSYNIFVEDFENKTPTVRPRYRWEDTG